MFNRLKNLLAPPVFADEEQTRLARLLTILLLGMIVTVVVTAPVLIALMPASERVFLLLISVAAVTILVGLFLVTQRGHVRLASAALPSALLVIVTVGISNLASLREVVTSAYLIVIVVAGLLLGGRGALVFMGLSVLAALGVLSAEAYGWVTPTLPSTGLRTWIVYSVIFGLMAWLLALTTRSIRAGLEEARRLSLERRTRERMAQALQRVGAAITASLDLPTVLATVCAETCAAFDADGVAVWLLAGDAAALQAIAAHGPSAERLLGEHIPLADPDSIVARAVRERHPLVVHNVQHAAEEVPQLKRATGAQALLVTLIVKDTQTLGALVIFDTRHPQRFGAEDLAAAGLLGAQIAVAIQNARLFEEAQRKTQELAGLYDAALATSGTLDAQALLTRLYEHVRKIMAPDAFGVFLYNADAEELEIALAMESDEEVPGAMGQRLPLREAGLTGWLIHSRQPLLVRDMQADPLPVEPRHVTRPARSWLGVPLLAREHVVGAVSVQSFRPRAFGEADRRFLESVAGQVAIALENTRLFAEMQRRADEMARLNDLTRAALETADLPQMLQMLADRLGGLIHADGCFITLWDEARQMTIPAAASGPIRESYRTMQLEPGELTMTASVLRAGRVLLAEDVFHTPYMSPRVAALFPTRSMLGLPLIAGGQKLGAALIGFDQPHHFTADEIALSEQAARQIALAVAKARALEAERKRSAELETLRQAGLRLTTQLELEPALQTILEQAMTLMGASNANLFLYDGEHLTFGAALGFEGFTRRAYTEPRAEGVTYAVARSGERMVVSDVNLHPLFQDWQWGGAIISLPLTIGGQVRGVMNIAFDKPRSFDENELRILDLLADQASVALEQARLFEAERRRAALLSLLEEVSRQVAGTLDEQEIFHRTVTAIVNRFGLAEAAISLPVGGDELELVAIAGTEDMGFTPGFRQKVGEGIIGHVAESQATYVTNDISRDAYYFSSPGRQAGSALGLPMLRERQLVGVLYVESSAPGAFETDDVRALETLANHVATTLQNARLYARTRDRLREMTALQSVSHTVASSLELSQIFQTVVQLLQDTFGYHYVSIYLLDGEVLRLGAQVGYPAELTYYEIPITTGITGRAARTRQTQFVKDVTADPNFLLASYDLGSEICVPLLKEQTVLGILNVEATRDRPLTEADVDLLTALAGPVTVAIDNARLFEAERKQRELAEALREVGAALSGSLDIETVLDRLLDQIARVVVYDTANVMLVAEGRTRIARARGYEPFGEEVVRDTSALSFEVATTENLRRMAESGQPLIIPDTAAFPGWVRVKASAFIRSWAGAPIMAQGQVVAFFSIGKQELNFYRPEDAKRLAAFSGLAALALQNAQLFEQTQRRAAQLSALNEIGRAVSTLLDVDSVMEVIYQQVQRSLPLDVFFVSLYDAETNTVANPFVIDGGQRYQEPLRPLIEDSHTGRTLRTAAPQLINCTPEELAAKAHHRHGIGDKSRPSASLLFAPLIVGLRVMGVISAQSYTLQAYTDEHLALLTGVASQAAIAIENARLFEAEERRAKMLAALHATSLDITFQHDLPTLLRTIVERAARLIGAPSGGLYLCNPDRQEARCMISYHTLRDYTGTVLKYGEEAAGRVAQTGKPLIIEDYRLWSGRAAVYENRPFTAVLSVPMIWQGQVTGVIDVEYNVETPGRFTQADLELLSQFANQAAIAVENARLLAETQRRAEEQTLLFNAARDFTAGLSEKAVLQAVARQMVSALNAAGCAVSLWEQSQDRVVTLWDYDAVDDALADRPGEAYALADYRATRRVLETRVPLALHVDDPDADPAESALLKQYGEAALLMLPLGAGENVFGLIELTRRAGAPRFSQADIRLGQSLAVEAGVALENARLHTTVQERVRELDALVTANSAMLSTLDLDPLLDNVLQAALAAIPAAEKGAILLNETADLHDADADQPARLQIRAVAGYSDPRIQTFAFAGSEGYSAKAVREKRPLLIPDARADLAIRYAGDIPEVRDILSAIAAPLMHHDHSLGVISLDATRRAAFTEADLRLLVAFANAAAVAIDNARLHAEVHALAVTDGLTGLPNHRAFSQALEVEVARAGRYDYPVSLVFLDIDSFKLFNDTYGHPAGNVRLIAIAVLLRERVREPDLAARYGGEEFAIILPHTPKDGALVLAERIRAAAEASAPEGRAHGVPVSGYTLSLGVATFPDDGHTPEDLLLAADNAELAAKRAGKNCVVAAPALIAR